MKTLAMKTLAISTLALALTACGGGGGGDSTNPTTPSTTKNVSGLAIDGYVEGATAFLDYNFNGVLDEGEPSAITNQNGRFDFTEVLENCAEFSPVIIDVPAGAYDSDYGVVTEPYRLTFPPKFSSDNAGDDLWATTPFTTVIWNSIRQELATEGAFDCHSLAENVELQTSIRTRVSQQEYRLANRYNIPVEDLYGDFIASGNTYQHQLAQKLVVGLSKAYEETIAFENANPDAHEAYVEYYLGNPASDDIELADTWYRREWVASPTHTVAAVYEVSEDLTTIVKMTDYLESESTVGEEVKHTRFVVLDDAGSDYNCTVQDRVSQLDVVQGDTVYEFAAIANTSANDVAECAATDVEANLSSSAVTAYAKEQYGRYSAYSQFDYQQGDNLDIDGLLYSLGQGTITEAGRFTTISYIDPAIDNVDNYGSLNWIRVGYEYPSDGSTVVTQHRSTGLWIVTTTAKSGTYSIQCGYDAENLQPADSEAQCLAL